MISIRVTVAAVVLLAVIISDKSGFTGEILDRVTMGLSRKKHRQNSPIIIHFPTSEGVSKVSE